MAHNKTEITELKNGKLVVKATALSGSIVSPASTKYITTIVDTARGPELAVKVTDLGGGGGGGITVDDELSTTSENPAQNKVITTELNKKVANTATAANATTLTGNPSAYTYTVNVGPNSKISGYYSVAIGTNAEANSDALAIGGFNTKATGSNSMAIGCSTAQATAQHAIAIGNNARALATRSMQIGPGDNTTPNTMQIESNQFYNFTSGKIVMARLPIEPVTQEQYDALVEAGTVDENTLYLIKPAA